MVSFLMFSFYGQFHASGVKIQVFKNKLDFVTSHKTINDKTRDFTSAFAGLFHTRVACVRSPDVTQSYCYIFSPLENNNMNQNMKANKTTKLNWLCSQLVSVSVMT